jgi:hypothetical protein
MLRAPIAAMPGVDEQPTPWSATLAPCDVGGQGLDDHRGMATFATLSGAKPDRGVRHPAGVVIGMVAGSWLVIVYSVGHPVLRSIQSWDKTPRSREHPELGYEPLVTRTDRARPPSYSTNCCALPTMPH